MRPGARVQAAIDILERWHGSHSPIDRILADWGRAHRFAGSGDRHAIANIVYDTLRSARSLQVMAGGADPDDGLAALDPRCAVLASRVAAGEDLSAVADGSAHAPAALTTGESARFARMGVEGPARLASAPRGACLDLPDCVADAGEPALAAIAEALRNRAPVYLRTNTLRATPSEAISALAEDGIDAAALPEAGQAVTGAQAPAALHVREGTRRIAGSRAYRDGLVELQDAASQASVTLAGVLPGMWVLDLCAGGGGKTLALGAALGGRGRLFAHDTAPRRMTDLPARARRAGLAVTQVASADLAGLRGRPDIVFVDAPCSGSGSWRRDPGGKWCFDAARRAKLVETQDRLIDQALDLVAPSGSVLFATCSFLPDEGEARLQALISRRPDLARMVSAASRFRCIPTKGGPDGFFAARLDRSAR
ncbi:MAG: RsmB/NOP family class I SAM-dependent RNA methyltransferase [Pseudomonadota bacterium]